MAEWGGDEKKHNHWDILSKRKVNSTLEPPTQVQSVENTCTRQHLGFK
jgi:hypothetical protein